jgi:hypothetical protein
LTQAVFGASQQAQSSTSRWQFFFSEAAHQEEVATAGACTKTCIKVFLSIETAFYPR